MNLSDSASRSARSHRQLLVRTVLTCNRDESMRDSFARQSINRATQSVRSGLWETMGFVRDWDSTQKNMRSERSTGSKTHARITRRVPFLPSVPQVPPETENRFRRDVADCTSGSCSLSFSDSVYVKKCPRQNLHGRPGA